MFLKFPPLRSDGVSVPRGTKKALSCLNAPTETKKKTPSVTKKRGRERSEGSARPCDVINVDHMQEKRPDTVKDTERREEIKKHWIKATHLCYCLESKREHLEITHKVLETFCMFGVALHELCTVGWSQNLPKFS